MTHAADATAALHRALDAAWRPVRDCGAAYAAAQKAAMEAVDVEDAMARAVDLIVAAEGLEDAAKGAIQASRDALAAAISETGAPRVVTMHFTAAMASKPQFASDDQPDLTPDEYMTKPHPDRKAILDALKRGTEVPGWSLRTPNSQTLRITKRK